MRCVQCKGPWHPSSGHWYEEWGIVVCGGCYKPFLAWLSGHLKRRWGKVRFYDEAATSIRAGVTGLDQSGD